MSDARPEIHAVDDDPSYLAAVARLLRAAGYSVKTNLSADEFLARASDDAGCVIADLHMPGMDGLELQQALANKGIELPLVFLSGEGDIPSTVQAMRHGAEDFLTKSAPKEQLFAAVDRALARDAQQRVVSARLGALRSRVATLSPRELGVLRHVVEGRMNKQIAADLGISERTVKLHRTAITTKLKVRSVAEVTRVVQAVGLFDEHASTFP
jgi:FixJ family two-component response regulator